MKYRTFIIITLVFWLTGCTFLKTVGSRDLIGTWVGRAEDGTVVKYEINGNLQAVRKNISNGEEGELFYQWKGNRSSIHLWGSGCFDFGEGLENIIIHYQKNLEIIESKNEPLKLLDSEENITFAKET